MSGKLDKYSGFTDRQTAGARELSVRQTEKGLRMVLELGNFGRANWLGCRYTLQDAKVRGT